MDLKLIITKSPAVEGFRDAIGINVVIPATDIPICGIFVWGQRNADLHIYETSLLRANAPSYIEVIQIAAELANLLYENNARSLLDVKKILRNASKTYARATLQVN